MNRDAFLATLIGFGIGLVITGLLLVAPGFLKSAPKFSWQFPKINLSQINPFKPKSLTTPTPAPTAFKFTIDSPLPEAIVAKDSLLVSGTATPGATIVIAGVLDETVLVVKDDAKYAGQVTLSEGKNEILVTSYLKQNATSQKAVVYYTQEQL